MENIEVDIITENIDMNLEGGARGFKGDKGDTGATGPRGPVGPQGEKGNPFTYEDFTPEQLEGLRGPQGIQGETGPTGPQGPKGDKGDTGPIGATGAQGPQGIQGIQGPKGDQGIQGQTGPQGPTGATGKDFSITKTYASISAMEADKNNVEEGSFVMITSNTEDEDNGKLYVKGATDFTFLSDLSGARGMKGDKGDTGEQGPQGIQGPVGPQGEQGIQGIQGEKGDKGEKGDGYTGVGTIASIGTDIEVDTLEAYVKNVELHGDTEQTTYTGKNLFDSQFELGTYNSSGAKTSSTTQYRNKNVIPVESNTTYTFSNMGATGYDLFQYDNSMNYLGYNYTRGTFNTMNNAAYLNIATSGNVSAIPTNVQLEKGSTATSYEPYVGGTASPNPDYPQEIKTATGYNEVNIVGKNLFDKDSVIENQNYLNKISVSNLETTETGLKWLASSNDSYIGLPATITGGYDMYIKVEENTTYTLSFNSNYELTNYIFYIKEDYTFIQRNVPLGHNSGVSFTTPINCKYVFVRFGASNQNGNTINITNIQLEKGNTATEYEAYKGQTYEIDLGKNLFDKDMMTLGFYITTNGATSESSYWNISDYIKVIAGEKYSYQGLVNVGSSSVLCAYYDNSKNYVSTFKQAIGNNTITIPSGISYVRFSVYANATDQDTFQLERGSQATSYAPFMKNNLFDKNNPNEATVWINEACTSAGVSSGDYSIYIPCLSNTTYKITSNVNIPRFRLASVSNLITSNVSLSNGVNADNKASATITTGANDIYLYVNLTSSNYINNLTIWNTSEAQYPIKLPNGNYIYKSNDKWYVHKVWDKIVLDGTESTMYINVVDNGYQFHILPGILPKRSSTEITMISDYFTGTYFGNRKNIDECIYGYSGDNGIRITTQIASTLADFKSWLSTNNVTVWYKLATETDVEITNERLLEQLEELYNSKMCEDKTYITTSGIDINPILKLITFNNNANGVTEYFNYMMSVIDNTYVRKITGKALSTNDFTDDYKNKIDYLIQLIGNGTDTYSSSTTYEEGEQVFYNYRLYEATQETTGNLPTDTDYWELVSLVGIE